MPNFMTYGDSVGNVNIDNLLRSHNSSSKLVTMTAVRPAARFGELDFDCDGAVKAFKEKPQLEQGWINGGYFGIEPQFFDYIGDDDVMLERCLLKQQFSVVSLMPINILVFGTVLILNAI